MNRLVDMFLAQKLCDLQFNFEEEDSVGAHTSILASGSPVFSAMFQCGLSESQSRTVAINDFDRGPVKHLVPGSLFVSLLVSQIVFSLIVLSVIVLL